MTEINILNDINSFLKRVTRDSNIIKSSKLSQSDKRLLREAIKQKFVFKLKNGFYCLSDYIFNLQYDFNDIVPGGIMCMYSAWFYHELSDFIPLDINLALPVGCKVVVPKTPKYKIHYRLNDNYTLGVINVHYNDNVSFNIYDVERCVCDAVKFRNKVGEDICEEIINSYIRRPVQDYEKLYEYARKLKVEKILKTYINKCINIHNMSF